MGSEMCIRDRKNIESAIFNVTSSSPFWKWRITAAMVLAYAAFLRVSEVQGLRLENCSFESGVLKLKIEKAKRRPDGFNTAVPLDSICGLFFKRYLSLFKLIEKQSGFVFPLSPLKFNQSVASSNFQEKLKLIVTENGWQGRYGFHSCKLGATTEAIKSGLSSDEVRVLARWKDTKLVARYTRFEEKAVARLAGNICG